VVAFLLYRHPASNAKCEASGVMFPVMNGKRLVNLEATVAEISGPSQKKIEIVLAGIPRFRQESGR
jgi:hypothetical protein